MVKRVCPMWTDMYPDEFAVFGGKLYFKAYDDAKFPDLPKPPSGGTRGPGGTSG